MGLGSEDRINSSFRDNQFHSGHSMRNRHVGGVGEGINNHSSRRFNGGNDDLRRNHFPSGGGLNANGHSPFRGEGRPLSASMMTPPPAYHKSTKDKFINNIMNKDIKRVLLEGIVVAGTLCLVKNIFCKKRK